MTKPKIKISNDVKKYVIKLCKKIERDSNEETISQAKSIRGFAEKCGTLTAGQGLWLCKCARYRKMSVPSELAALAEHDDHSRDADPKALPVTGSGTLAMDVSKILKLLERHFSD
jgi:hypothetical protein